MKTVDGRDNGPHSSGGHKAVPRALRTRPAHPSAAQTDSVTPGAQQRGQHAVQPPAVGGIERVDSIKNEGCIVRDSTKVVAASFRLSSEHRKISERRRRFEAVDTRGGAGAALLFERRSKQPAHRNLGTTVAHVLSRDADIKHAHRRFALSVTENGSSRLICWPAVTGFGFRRRRLMPKLDERRE